MDAYTTEGGGKKKKDLENQVVIPLFLEQPEANKQILLQNQTASQLPAWNSASLPVPGCK